MSPGCLDCLENAWLQCLFSQHPTSHCHARQGVQEKTELQYEGQGLLQISKAHTQAGQLQT